jgi:hypothetical protein
VSSNGCFNLKSFSKLPSNINRVEYHNTESVDPETHESHEEYLAAFKRTLIEKLRHCIDKGLSHDPDGGKGKKKTVQVSFMLHKKFMCGLCVIARANRENLLSR